MQLQFNFFVSLPSEVTQVPNFISDLCTPGARKNLGDRYGNGQGVAKDYVEAAKWWQLAAEQGHAGAQNNLGTLYAEGQGVTQDNVSAYLWFSLAAAQGDKGAINNLDRVAHHMSQAQILEAKKLVSEWQPKKSQTD